MHDDTRTLARFLVRELARADRQAAETGAVVGLYEFHRGEAAAYRMALAHIAGTNGHRTVDTFIAQVRRELEAGPAARAAGPEVRCLHERRVTEIGGVYRCDDCHREVRTPQPGEGRESWRRNAAMWLDADGTDDRGAWDQANAHDARLAADLAPMGGWEPRT